MDRRSFLASTVGVALGAVALSGCGGGGGGAGSRQVRGTVALPGGALPSGLRVESGYGASAAGAGGAFSLPIGADPTLAWARVGDAVALLGFLGVGGGAQDLSPRSTAVALLYFGLGGFLLPASNLATLLGLLDAHPATGPLAAALSTRLAADPRALAAGDPAIAQALQSAMDAVLADRPNPNRSVAARSRQTTIPALLLVQPGGLQSHVEVLQGAADQTIVATNHGRRYAEVRIYEVGTEDALGNRSNYPKAKLVPGGVYDLGSTRALGFASTIFGFYSGATAFVPVSTSPIPLTMTPGAVKTYFQAVVLGSSSQLTEPAFFQNSRYADELAAWRGSVGELNLLSWFGDVVFGLLLEIWGLHDLVVSRTAMKAALAQLKNLHIDTWLQVLNAAETGDFARATRMFFALFAVDPNFVTSLQAILVVLSPQIQRVVGKTVSALSLQLVTKAISAAFATAGAVLGAGDLGAVLYDLAHAERGELWDITLFQPHLQLAPTSTTVRPGGRVDFTASLSGIGGGGATFVWSRSGATNAVFSHGVNAGQTLETDGAVTLVTAPSDSGAITVTCKAYVTRNGTRTLIETRIATVTVTDDPAVTIVFSNPHSNSRTNVLDFSPREWPQKGVPLVDRVTGAVYYRAIEFTPSEPFGANDFNLQFYAPSALATGMVIPFGAGHGSNVCSLGVRYAAFSNGETLFATTGSLTVTAVNGRRVDFKVQGHFEASEFGGDRATADVLVTGWMRLP